MTFTASQAIEQNRKFDARGRRRKPLGEGDKDALILRNEHGKATHIVYPPPKKPKTRIRQSSKPLMNKLETDFHSWLLTSGGVPKNGLCIQAITFRIANGLRYTPDFVSILARITAWEVKGEWVDGDSFPKLKMFAAAYPEILVKLAWRQDGQWQEQTILP